MVILGKGLKQISLVESPSALTLNREGYILQMSIKSVDKKKPTRCHFLYSLFLF